MLSDMPDVRTICSGSCNVFLVVFIRMSVSQFRMCMSLFLDNQSLARSTRELKNDVIVSNVT